MGEDHQGRGREAGVRRGALVAALCISLLACGGGAAQAVETRAASVWALLRQPGAIVLMRHAEAPGVGDPANFRLGDCATQRNLDDRGRAQARAIGARLKAEGVAVVRVLTSEWCRARETAELLGAGPVEPAGSALNSFFERRQDRERATAALRDLIAGLPSEGGVSVLVTHQVNITALTGVNPRSGEMVVLRRAADGSAVVFGRLAVE